MKRKRNEVGPVVPRKAQRIGALTLQLITGSYERVLHGFTAEIQDGAATFTNTFLFSAHSSSIRSLAISPSTQGGKRVLATGSADERINLYQLSSSPSKGATLPGLGSSISKNPRNRELGSLLHHSRTVTRLSFPSKSKLFSAADDNTIAITRMRDWTMLSSIKAPIPKQQGRPSGDTAAAGEVPAGVNDFAIHPSMKLMISVGKGEKCMRLWNLVTGKKAGVLSFDRHLLTQVGEGKYSTGEGRRIMWDRSGTKFVVVFERGAVVYDMDSQPVAVITPTPSTKLHQARFLPGAEDILAVSTEGGRLLFFNLAKTEESPRGLPSCACVGQIESPTLGTTGRVKDFEIFEIPGDDRGVIMVTASSDGTVRLWQVKTDSFVAADAVASKQIGNLVGVRETHDRLTCLAGFVMDSSSDQQELDDDIPLPAPDDVDQASDSSSS